jgi:predicted ATPase
MGAIGERLIGYASDTGLQPMVPYGKFFRGEALTHRAEIVEGGCANTREPGRISMPSWLAFLADALGRSDKTEEGLAMVEDALKTADVGGERFGLLEIHRLKGRLLLDRSADRDAAAAAYWQAIEIARDQQARLLELRAATSLAQLWGENGKRHAAREMLALVYQWFTEGFDKPDLRDAKALLDALA